MTRDERVVRAIAEAAEWRLIGLLFERPREGWREEIRALAREIDKPELRNAARMVDAATEGEYLRLLGPGSAISPREVAYQPLADPGAILADLSALYEAFAYHPRAEDPIDHVAVEAGFVGYLFLKEAYAQNRGDEEAAERTAAVRVRFLDSHLSAFGGFVQRLEAAGPSCLAGCARLLGSRLPEPSAPGPDVREVDPSSACASCDRATASIDS